MKKWTVIVVLFLLVFSLFFVAGSESEETSNQEGGSDTEILEISPQEPIVEETESEEQESSPEELEIENEIETENVEELITEDNKLAGDTNDDNKVNVLDLINVRNHIGDGDCSDEGNCNGVDTNDDNKVNVLDALVVRNNLGNKTDDNENVDDTGGDYYPSTENDNPPKESYQNPDVNGDSNVNILDTINVRNNLGKTSCNYENRWCDGADTNRDNKADVLDALVVRNNLGKKYNYNVVAEDGSKINILDLIYVRNHLSCIGECGDADINQDGKVSIIDLYFIRDNLGSAINKPAINKPAEEGGDLKREENENLIINEELVPLSNLNFSKPKENEENEEEFELKHLTNGDSFLTIFSDDKGAVNIVGAGIFLLAISGSFFYIRRRKRISEIYSSR